VRNATAASDKVPAFFITLREQPGQPVGHLFVGRPDGATIYFGELYHCDEHVKIRVFYNRALRVATDPLLSVATFKPRE
jgi:hypothetical protein